MKLSILIFWISFICLPLHAVESIRLTDVIKSSGLGDVNLLKDLTVAQVESYRQEHSGHLVFGVDVNEAANGTEKSSSQGLTVQSCVLSVTWPNGEVSTYSNFETQTKATVAAASNPMGQEPRIERYTLLGETGSSRITSSNDIQNSFDSTLKIQVLDDISTATSLTLAIQLLETDDKRGDPEAFYDFSNGFEDLAILGLADANFLNALAPGRDEAPAVELTYPEEVTDLSVTNVIYYPNSSTPYTVAYEDLFPSAGDYDFNDLVVNYQIRFHLNSKNRLVKISGTCAMMSRGAGYDHDWKLKIDLPQQSSGTFSCNLTFPPGDPRAPILQSKVISGAFNETIFSHTKMLYAPYNTKTESGFEQAPMAEFSLDLDADVPLSQVDTAPFDPYLFVHDSQFEIHLVGKSPSAGSYNITAGKTSFVDQRGLPFAMLVPEHWAFPLENRDLGEAFPNFIEHILSNGQDHLDWFQYPKKGLTKKYLAKDFAWWQEF